MRIWIVCFLVLFGSAEVLEWAQQFSLPMPIFVLGGAFLAIASNYSKLTYLPFHPDHDSLEPVADPAAAPTVPPAPATPAPQSQASQKSTPISFEISKPFQPKG